MSYSWLYIFSFFCNPKNKETLSIFRGCIEVKSSAFGDSKMVLGLSLLSNEGNAVDLSSEFLLLFTSPLIPSQHSVFYICHIQSPGPGSVCIL